MLVRQDISPSVCANVSTWSSEKGYLETGVLMDLFPLNGTTPPPHINRAAAERADPTLFATVGGYVAVVNSGILIVSAFAFFFLRYF